jgi:hypothetical protein
MRLSEAEGKPFREVLEETKTMPLFSKWCLLDAKLHSVNDEDGMSEIVESNAKLLRKEIESSLLWRMTDRIDVVLQTILAGKVGTAELMVEVL